MIFRAPPTRSALPFARTLMHRADSMGRDALNLSIGRLDLLQAKRDRVLGQIDRVREERLAKKAEDTGMGADDWGAIAGGTLAVAAAPFTGGATLASIPYTAGLGRGVGQLIEGDTAGGMTSLGTSLASSAPSVFSPQQPVTLQPLSATAPPALY